LTEFSTPTGLKKYLSAPESGAFDDRAIRARTRQHGNRDVAPALVTLGALQELIRRAGVAP